MILLLGDTTESFQTVCDTCQVYHSNINFNYVDIINVILKQWMKTETQLIYLLLSKSNLL